MFCIKEDRGTREGKNCMTSFVTEGWFPAAPYEAGVRGSRTTVEQLGRTRDRSLFISWGDGGFKGGSLKTLDGFRVGATQICLENQDMGEGGDHFSEVTFKEEIG